MIILYFSFTLALTLVILLANVAYLRGPHYQRILLQATPEARPLQEAKEELDEPRGESTMGLLAACLRETLPFYLVIFLNYV
jgi:hypothetical protein